MCQAWSCEDGGPEPVADRRRAARASCNAAGPRRSLRAGKGAVYREAVYTKTAYTRQFTYALLYVTVYT